MVFEPQGNIWTVQHILNKYGTFQLNLESLKLSHWLFLLKGKLCLGLPRLFSAFHSIGIYSSWTGSAHGFISACLRFLFLPAPRCRIFFCQAGALLQPRSNGQALRVAPATSHPAYLCTARLCQHPPKSPCACLYTHSLLRRHTRKEESSSSGG